MTFLKLLFGKFGKFLFCTVFIIFLILLITCTLEEFSQDIKNVLFTESSIDEISILFIIGMFIGGFFGINGIFRTGGMIFPLVFIGLLLIFISLFSKIDITNLTPILGNGANEIFIKGAYKIGRYNFISILFLLNPYIKNIKKTGFLSLGISGVMITLILFLLFSVIPYPTMIENYFSLFELTRLVGFGRFFQRFESVFTFIWIIMTYIYISTGFSLIIYTIKKTFNFKYINRLLPLFAVLILSLTHYMPSYNFAIFIMDNIYKFIGPLIVIVFPLLLMLIAKIKVKFGGKNETS